jgi:hypothetical protein
MGVVWPSDGYFRVIIAGSDQGGVGGIPIYPESSWGLSINWVDIQRSASSGFVSHQATGITGSGNTTVWTPANGRFFSLIGYIITVSQNASKSAGALAGLTLTDGAGGTVIASHRVFFPGTAVTTQVGSVIYQSVLGPIGYLSSTVNNPLVFNMSGGALATGSMDVSVWGFEWS